MINENGWAKISDFVVFTTKGITPKYSKNSTIRVLNQKCIRNGKIDFSLSRFTDDKKILNESKFVKNGDILINSTGIGTAGRCSFIEDLPDNFKLTVDSHILIIRCTSYLVAKCIYYILFVNENMIMKFLTGSSGQAELDKEIILNLKVKIPNSESEAKKTISVLTSINKKIETNNKMNLELENLAKTIYDYWFVQFDFPDENGKPYKSSGGKLVWNEDLQKETPEVWEVSKVSNFLKIHSGFAFKSKNYTDCGNYKIVTIKNVQDDELNTTKCDLLREIPKKISNENILKIGDILISLTGNVGRLCIVDEENLLLNQRVGKLISDLKFKNYMYYFIKSDFYQNKISRLASGSSQKNLSPIEATNMYFLVPNEEILSKFNNLINLLILKKINNNVENKKLVELRDWLLPMLMNGQVTIND